MNRGVQLFINSLTTYYSFETILRLMTQSRENFLSDSRLERMEKNDGIITLDADDGVSDVSE